jgi:excinuclease UvrABC helicase subunit UvrB
LDIYSSTDKQVYRCLFDEEKLEMIQLKDSVTFENKGSTDKITIWPATQYLQNVDDLNSILDNILIEMNARADDLDKQEKIVEAQRLRKRVDYDVRMIRETGFVNGIENYSPYFDGRIPGEVPYTIFDYLPDDFLLIVDESHMTLPQLMAMPKADTARKVSLVNHGFRLPSAVDHRPIRFEELEVMMDRAKDTQSVLSKKIKLQTDADNDEEIPLTEIEQKVYDYQTYRNDLFQIPSNVKKNHTQSLEAKRKTKSKALFVSATPAPYELTLTKDNIIEQVIRPT